MYIQRQTDMLLFGREREREKERERERKRDKTKHVYHLLFIIIISSSSSSNSSICTSSTSYSSSSSSSSSSSFYSSSSSFYTSSSSSILLYRYFNHLFDVRDVYIQCSIQASLHTSFFSCTLRECTQAYGKIFDSVVVYTREIHVLNKCYQMIIFISHKWAV